MSPQEIIKLLSSGKGTDDGNKSGSGQKSETNLQQYKKFLTSSNEILMMSDTQKLRNQMDYDRKLNVLKNNINEYYSGFGSEDN